MNRRELLLTAGASAFTLGLSSFPRGWSARADSPRRNILVFTRSQGFEHSVVKRTKKPLSLVEEVMTDLGKKHGFDVKCTKDGREFLPENLAKYDGFFFETTGDLTREGGDNNPPMPPEGKQALLQAIASGKGFIGAHCASDTFHSPGHNGGQFKNQETVDPYIAMVGGEFAGHGAQQRSWMRVTDAKFPGIPGDKGFGLEEEWYSLKNFTPDLHVILVQETTGMKNFDYERPNYPATWARMHEKGRVFYTSMGHREDVWGNPLFHQILMGGLAWAVGNVNAATPPNLEKAAPQARDLPMGEKKRR